MKMKDKFKNSLNSKENKNTNKKVEKDKKLFPQLMDNSDDLTLEETVDIEELLEDD